ncbi:MAG: SDR family NAD(P)-dependent oxidoreductase [Gemmatimonadota bacterium]
MTGHAGALDGSFAVVTGATRGIGRAVALGLTEAGARVALIARDGEALARLAGDTGGRAFPCDVSDAGALDSVGDDVMAWGGGSPDILVTSAGVFDLAPVATMSVEVLDRNLRVNLRGGVLSVRAFLPAMLEARRGTIVQVGSVAGRRAFPENGAYSASKFGLRGFHEVLLEEIRGTGVRATLLEPAATDTSIWDPMDPDANEDLPDREAMLDAASVAEAVLFAVTRPEGVQVPFLPIERS